MTPEILAVLACALVLDRLVGDPGWLWERLPHPVVLFGKAIAAMDRRFNGTDLAPGSARRNGVFSILALLALSAVSGWVTHAVLSVFGWAGTAVEIVIVAVFLAQKSLSDHVGRVAAALREGGLPAGRQAVSMIVGRDPATLDEPAVCRAALESLAENFSDGVVAPAFWYAVCGLPGLLVYKMLNTADSMIGHKSEKYLHFGWASARLDDLANLPASRLSALLMAAGAWAGAGRTAMRNALAVAWRDHAVHRSPNAGWPESALAGALDVQLAGPRIYSGVTVDDPMINAPGRRVATPMDIEQGIRFFALACNALFFLVAGLFLLRIVL